MAENDSNDNTLKDREDLEEKKRIERETISRMFAGAKREQAVFDELQKLRKELRNTLQVILHKIHLPLSNQLFF